MFKGLFGTKPQNVPQPAAPTEPDFTNAPNYKRVCQLVGYKPVRPIKEAYYFYESKNFCCAVSNEGVIFGVIDDLTRCCTRYRLVLRLADIGEVDYIQQFEGFRMNDNGTELRAVCLYNDWTKPNINPDCHEYVLFPADDFEKFRDALLNAGNEERQLGQRYGYGSFEYAPQPAAPADDFANAPNFKRICQLLDYKPMLPIKEAGYFFVSKHFCCAVSNEGIIYAAPCTETMMPYFHGLVIRPFQIAKIISEESGLNDDGVVLQCVSVFIHDPDDCVQVCIPPDDWSKFNAAVKDCVESDAMGGKHEYGGFQQM